MSRRLAVLAWHNVQRSWCFPVAPGTGSVGLERQLRVLRRIAHVVPLEQALEDLRSGRSLRPRSVALTFDDGYRDNLDLAVPLLERMGLPATFFLVPGLLSRTVRAWWEVAAWAFACSRRARLRWEGHDLDLTDAARRRDAFERSAERLKRRDRVARDAALEGLVNSLDPSGSPDDRELFLDWEGARALVRRGFAVGSHSMYHAILSQETPEDQHRDLAESRARIEQALNLPVRLLAYPNGTVRDYDEATILAAERAGYHHAMTTRAGLNGVRTPPYEVRRSVVSSVAGSREWRWILRDAVRAR